MIRVLHVFGRMDRGGAEMRTLELMPLLSERGVQFDFCTLLQGEGLLDERIRRLGGQVFPCPLRPGLLSFGRRFLEILEQSDFDIVHTHIHYFGGNIVRLAHKAGIRGRIVHFRNTFDGQVPTLSRRMYRLAMRKLIDRHSTAILAVCRGAMEFGWGANWWKDPRCQVSYNGLDLSRFTPIGNVRENILRELGLAAESKLIINVGRFSKQKAHDVLLAAAREVLSQNRRIHFLLVGGGPLKTAIEERTREYGIEANVHFLGVRDDVPRLLKSSDCFVLSSRWEGLPGVVLEAVAANLPTIATDLAGVREIAEHTSLIHIVPVENSSALAESILEQIEELAYRPVGETPFPCEFDLDVCADRLFNTYLRQVERPQGTQTRNRVGIQDSSTDLRQEQ